MTEQAISPLRRRMIEDMSIRKFAAKTHHDYVQRVKDFATFLGRPVLPSPEDPALSRPAGRAASGDAAAPVLGRQRAKAASRPASRGRDRAVRRTGRGQAGRADCRRPAS